MKRRLGQVLVEERIGTGIGFRKDWGRYWLKRRLGLIMVEERIGAGIG